MKKYVKIGQIRSYIKIKYIGEKVFSTEKEFKINPNKKQKTLVKI